MRVFIFGAGASVHVGDPVGYPLTKDLGWRLIGWATEHCPPHQLYWIDGQELAKFGSLDDIEQIVTRLEEAQKSGPTLAGLRNALCWFFDSIRLKEAAPIGGLHKRSWSPETS